METKPKDAGRIWVGLVAAGLGIAVLLLSPRLTPEPARASVDDGQPGSGVERRSPDEDVPTHSPATPGAAEPPSDAPRPAPSGTPPPRTDDTLSTSSALRDALVRRAAAAAEAEAMAQRDAGPVRYALSRDGIKDAMRASLPEFEECYAEWSRMHPDLAGKLTLQFTIGAGEDGNGKVTQVSLADGGIGQPLFEACILAVVGDLPFEAPRAGVMEVRYPILFAQRPDGG